jgi:hypothetical protein
MLCSYFVPNKYVPHMSRTNNSRPLQRISNPPGGHTLRIYDIHPSNGATAQIQPWPSLSPQCCIISGQLPVATAQKSGSILLYHNFPSFPGISNRSYSFKRSFKHFLRNSCAFNPLDMSLPLKPFQFDTCYKVRFTVQFIQFLVVWISDIKSD